MPATAPEIARRVFLLSLAAPLVGDARHEILDLFTEMASALSEGNGLAFLDHIGHSMPDYEKFQQNILALVEQAEVLSAIDLLKEEGDDRTRSVEVDWFLQIRSREQSGPLVRRREIIKCRLARAKKKWKVTSLDPAGFFAPPR